VASAIALSGIVWTGSPEQTLFVGEAEAIGGTQATIPVMIVEADAIDTFGFDITFDHTFLTFEEMFTTGALTSDWSAVGGNEVSTGVVRIGAVRGPGTPVGSAGVLCYLTFSIQTGASGATALTPTALRDDIRGSIILPGSIGVREPVLTVSVESMSVSAGSVVAVPILVADATGMEVFALQLNFDNSKLVYLGVSGDGTLISNWAALGANEMTPGQLTLGAFRGGGAEIWGSGVLVRVLMLVRAVPEGQTPLTLSGLKDDLATAVAAPGTLTILPSSSTAARPSWRHFR
jgi:hypothetical protein